MARKRTHTSPTPSEAPTARREAFRVPADWQHHLDKPGDPNYLGVSEVFRQFSEPMFDGASSLGEITIGCQIAMLAWNLAALPSHLRPKLVAPALQAMPLEMQALTRHYLSMLISRKETLFEQYRWLIDDCKVEEVAGEFRLVVAARELVESDSGSSCQGQ
jgi:hypothetical protein